MDFNGKISAYPPKLSETQLQTVSIARALSRPPLGFTRSLVDVWCMAEVLFFSDLDGLGGIRSTWGKHPSKNTYNAEEVFEVFKVSA